jgi:DNA repair protein RadA/Sms
MSKSKTIYICQNCGTNYSQWLGQCKSCQQWGTIVEEVIEKKSVIEEKKTKFSNVETLHKISSIEALNENRISTQDTEFDRVLGGGLVSGSVVLIGGEPGIGKSTLLLQVALKLKNLTVLYVSGEESTNQIKLRSERLHNINPECYILTETNTQKIIKTAQKIQPNLLVIDSIQTLYSSFLDSTIGSVSQIRECTQELTRFAKETSIPILIIGHITKDGTIAGPKILEHMVDVVLQFEGDRNHLFRLLRSHKNRYGSTSELGIYEMNSAGLREVNNPSELLISKKDESLSGNAIACTLEGMRPILIEVQALVSTAVYGTPQRSSTGFDARRLNMLLAVLEKRSGFHLGSKDVFLNITGGIKIEDPAIDLAVICAILSSNEDVALPDNCCFAAEIGLSGEVRPVTRIEQRISEAEKLGYDVIFISKYNKINPKEYSIRVELIAKVEEIYRILF